MAFGLLPRTQTGMIAHHELAYHDHQGTATDMEERERLVADLGAQNTMLLCNHRTLTVGETIGYAFLRMYFLERACEAEVHMLSTGRENLYLAAGHAREGGGADPPNVTRIGADMLAWPALLRKLDRIDPSFRE